MENNEEVDKVYWKDLHCRDCDHYSTISDNYGCKHPYCLWHECRVLPGFKACEAFSIKDGE